MTQAKSDCARCQGTGRLERIELMGRFAAPLYIACPCTLERCGGSPGFPRWKGAALSGTWHPVTAHCHIAKQCSPCPGCDDCRPEAKPNSPADLPLEAQPLTRVFPGGPLAPSVNDPDWTVHDGPRPVPTHPPPAGLEEAVAEAIREASKSKGAMPVTSKEAILLQTVCAPIILRHVAPVVEAQRMKIAEAEAAAHSYKADWEAQEGLLRAEDAQIATQAREIEGLVDRLRRQQALSDALDHYIGMVEIWGRAGNYKPVTDAKERCLKARAALDGKETR